MDELSIEGDEKLYPCINNYCKPLKMIKNKSFTVGVQGLTQGPVFKHPTPHLKRGLHNWWSMPTGVFLHLISPNPVKLSVLSK